MRSSWEEVEKLFINHWRATSTPLHAVFMGKTVPVTFNAGVVIGADVPLPVMGSKFFVLYAPSFECFVASDVVTSIEYSEPDETRDKLRERYSRFVEFKCDEGSSLLLGELIDTDAPVH
jgi:hypothetical protein